MPLKPNDLRGPGRTPGTPVARPAQESREFMSRPSRSGIPKRDTLLSTSANRLPGPMLFPSPEAPARVVAPSALRPARRSQRATLGLVGPTRVEGLEQAIASLAPVVAAAAS